MYQRIRLALISAITAIVTYVAKPWLGAQIQKTGTLSQIAIYAIILCVLMLVIASLDYLVSLPYEGSARFRRFVDRRIKQKCIEGFWVDVSVDGSVRSRIANYGFVCIKREKGNYIVEGKTWNKNDVPEYEWVSVWEKHSGDDLEFWYRYRGIDSALDKGSKAKFSFPRVLEPNTYIGSYEGAYSTFAVRIPSGDLDFYKHWREEFPQRAQKLARSYLDKFMNERKYNRHTYVKDDSGPARNARDWYRTFVIYSNDKNVEKTLVKRGLDELCFGTPAQSILDIGPGEGDLTSMLMASMSSRKPQPKYLALEPNGEFCDSLSQTLKKQGFDEGNINILVKRAEVFAPAQWEGKFDLIIAFNSFYFVQSLKGTLRQIIKTLRPGGRLGCLHTEITATRFLNDIIRKVNPNINCDVIEQITATAAAEGLSMVSTLQDTVVVDFPQLDEARWQLLRNREMETSDDKMSDFINLICFLVNVDFSELSARNDWHEIVAWIREYLLDQGNKIQLPIKLQIFERKK